MSYVRHRFVYFALRPFFRAFLKMRYNYTSEKYDATGPVLILPNHTCTMDPVMVAMSFKKPIYFVTSDHLLRKGIIGRGISFLVEPIGKVKSASDLVTVKKMVKKLSQGKNVCVFPEGNRSFHGCTTYISPAIGKLIKMLNVDVVLYNIDKGYISDPRWADTIRRGELRGFVKEILKPEAYKQMTSDQITQAVIKGLYVNPTPLDNRNTQVFKGRRLAEHLELAVFICPKCHGIAKIRTGGDHGICTGCGMQFTYTPTGYLEGTDLPFITIKQWDEWQREFIIKNPVSDGEPILSDSNDVMYKIIRAKINQRIGKGELILYKNRLEFWPYDSKTKSIFYFTDIENMIVHGKQVLQISSTDKKTYEFKNKNIRSAIKYMYYFYHLKDEKRGDSNEFFGI